MAGDLQLQTGDPVKRLERITRVIAEQKLARYDLSICAWSQHDRTAANAVRKVYRRRYEYIRSIFSELGFRGAELEMRTRLYVAYHTWERATFPPQTKAEG